MDFECFFHSSEAYFWWAPASTARVLKGKKTKFPLRFNRFLVHSLLTFACVARRLHHHRSWWRTRYQEAIETSDVSMHGWRWSAQLVHPKGLKLCCKVEGQDAYFDHSDGWAWRSSRNHDFVLWLNNQKIEQFSHFIAFKRSSLYVEWVSAQPRVMKKASEIDDDLKKVEDTITTVNMQGIVDGFSAECLAQTMRLLLFNCCSHEVKLKIHHLYPSGFPEAPRFFGERVQGRKEAVPCRKEKTTRLIEVSRTWMSVVDIPLQHLAGHVGYLGRSCAQRAKL